MVLVSEIDIYNNDGNYNPKTPTNRLATLDQLRDRHRLSSVAIASLEQMRFSIFCKFKALTLPGIRKSWLSSWKPNV